MPVVQVFQRTPITDVTDHLNAATMPPETSCQIIAYCQRHLIPSPLEAQVSCQDFHDVIATM